MNEAGRSVEEQVGACYDASSAFTIITGFTSLEKQQQQSGAESLYDPLQIDGASFACAARKNEHRGGSSWSTGNSPRRRAN